MFLTSFKHFFYICHGLTCILILMNEGVRFHWSYLCLCLYNTADITSNEQPQFGQFSLAATRTLERFSSWLQWYTPLLSGVALVNPENHPRGWRWRPNHLRSATCLVSSRRVRCLWLFAPFLVGRTLRHPSYPAFWWMENNGPPGIRRCYFVRPRNPIDRIEWRVVPENQPSPVKSPRQRNFHMWLGMQKKRRKIDDVQYVASAFCLEKSIDIASVLFFIILHWLNAGTFLAISFAGAKIG